MTTYVIGRTTGVEVGRADSAAQAMGIAHRNGLGPDDIYSVDDWTELQIERHRNAQPAHRAEQRGEAGTISDVSIARQDRTNDAIAKVMAKGWAPTDTVYERGMRVNAIGVANLDRHGAQLDACGPLEGNLRDVARAVEAEDRRSIAFDITDAEFNLSPEGMLRLGRKGTGKPGLPVTRTLLGNMLGYYDEFSKLAPAVLADVEDGGLDPSDKVEMLNKYIVDRLGPNLQFRRDNRHTRRRARKELGAKDGRLLLWVRKQAGEWQAFHVSSPKHASKGLNVGQMANLIADAIDGAGYKGEAKYNPETSKLEFNGWQMPNHIVDLAAGDVFKGGFSGSSGDTNNGGYDLRVSFLRNLCLNLIIVAQEDGKLLWAPHNARPASVKRDLRENLRKVDEVMAEVFPDLEALRKPAGFDERDEEGVRKVLLAVAKLGGMPTGRSHDERDALVDAMYSGFKAEPGHTYSDALNALSRLHFQKELDAYTVAQVSGVAMEKLLIKARNDEPIINN